MIERVAAALHAHRDKLLFLVVGGFNTVFSYALFALGLWLTSLFIPGVRENWLLVDAVLVATWVISVTFSWSMFKLFVFARGEPTGFESGRGPTRCTRRAS